MSSDNITHDDVFHRRALSRLLRIPEFADTAAAAAVIIINNNINTTIAICYYMLSCSKIGSPRPVRRSGSPAPAAYPPAGPPVPPCRPPVPEGSGARPRRLPAPAAEQRAAHRAATAAVLAWCNMRWRRRGCCLPQSFFLTPCFVSPNVLHFLPPSPFRNSSVPFLSDASPNLCNLILPPSF